MKTIDSLITRLRDAAASTPELVSPGAADQNLEALKSAARLKLGSQPPDTFLDFLQLSDGFEWQGLHMYGTHESTRQVESLDMEVTILGFVEENVGYWKGQPSADRQVVFGYDDAYFYSLDQTTGAFARGLRGGGGVVERFVGFEEMMSDALVRAGLESE